MLKHVNLYMKDEKKKQEIKIFGAFPNILLYFS